MSRTGHRGYYHDGAHEGPVVVLEDRSDEIYVRLTIRFELTGKGAELLGHKDYPAYWGWSIDWFEKQEAGTWIQ